jgi:hypothetical protein
MPIYLKQSTASQEIPLGPFLDDTDGKTAEDGLTIANTDIKIWKAGATTLANKNSGGATHIAGGIYHATLDATDTSTLGPLVVFVHVAGALPVRLECAVLAANVYDSLIAASDSLVVDAAAVATLLGTPAGANLSADIAAVKAETAAIVDDTGTAGVVVNAAGLATDAVTEIVNAIKSAVVESEGSYTIQQVLSITLAVLAGVTTDAGATIKTPNGSASRVAATINTSSERTGMVLTPSA